jgi:predicted ABC-type sugar transport system permease subunit
VSREGDCFSEDEVAMLMVSGTLGRSSVGLSIDVLASIVLGGLRRATGGLTTLGRVSGDFVITGRYGSSVIQVGKVWKEAKVFEFG